MIRFENVIKTFGDRRVLDSISFEVKAGEILFILGTSGTGKSVLLKNIVGLLRPTSGKIFVDNTEVSQLSEDEYFDIRRKCGMVFQHPALFDSLSVHDNICFGLRRHFKLSEDQIDKRVQEVLRLVNLPKISEQMPNSLSYGMQKRVSLARTIAIGPKILLFDEPTTGLDPVTTTTINELIRSLSRTLNTTSLVVSHDMRCALAIADKIIVLDKGKIIAWGSPSDLKNSDHPLVVEFLQEALAIASTDSSN